ncbi:protein D2-like [Penaeus monodon]|uniref:protein D2-like n=1 Tax=Penaeus monodon TaxID=6687 RepID=UPI0018A703A8|nr:protein D2-like [Penaeus monodon]
MEQHEVVPDVLDEVPPDVVQIKYAEAEVNNGNVLTPTQVFSPPTYMSWPAKENALYTLCMTDPDAPSRQEPKFREFHHWLVVNIPGSDFARGNVLSDYVGSGPPKGTGLHRYVFIVYEQPGALECDEPIISKNSADHRRSFSIRKFAAKYNLRLSAGNFYQAEYDPSTDLVHKQLGLRK